MDFSGIGVPLRDLFVKNPISLQKNEKNLNSPISTFTQEAPDPGCCLAIDMRIHSMSRWCTEMYGLYCMYTCI